MAESWKVVAHFGYQRSADQDASVPARHPVIVVGAGPVGMSLALDLASRGIPPVLLDDSDRIGEGSRGICWSKRTLEVWDRLGVGEALDAKGVEWQKGKVFQREALVYEFDLLPDGGQKMPAFINLQQFTVEQELVGAIKVRRDIDLRWRNRVIGIERRADGAIVTVETPDGPYKLSCDWLVLCDGARSPCRDMLGLEFAGEVFDDQFLIADVKMTADFPTERWFWFDPPFHAGQSALLHRQPDDIWRIDLQIGTHADAEAEKAPERVRPRIARMLGHENFELEWVSVYRFRCCRIADFVHGRVVLAGDAAHQVSPFGARGANSGVQDAENLAWKLAAVLRGESSESLIATYNLERGQAADQNIWHSSASTSFIAPRTPTERLFRDAAIALGGTTGFAKRIVNSGRLSVANVYDSPLTTPDREAFAGTVGLGTALPDAPVGLSGGVTAWLLERLRGNRFMVLTWGVPDIADLERISGHADVIVVGRDIFDREGLLTTRFDAQPGSTYVIRPDQHLTARLRHFDVMRIEQAIARAMGKVVADGGGVAPVAGTSVQQTMVGAV